MSDEEVLDREMVARILRRASELADSAAVADADSGLRTDALIAAADEIGLPEPVIRRSIAFERLGPVPELRSTDRMLGAAVVVAEDEIQGSSAAVLQRMDAWMVDGHHLRRDRLRDGSAEWSRRTGPVGAIMHAVRGATGEGHLGDLDRVDAVARDTGTGSCVVRVSADRSRDRRLRASGGTVVATLGSAGVFVAAAASTPVLVVAAPVPILAGAWVAATGRRRARRTQHELERVLESVHHGGNPTRLGVDVVRRVTGRNRRL